jgi:RNA-binding protein
MPQMTDSPEARPADRSATALSARERATLKARAHALEPVVRLGHAGLSDAAVAQVDGALDAHELIKVKIGEGDRDARAALADQLCARTGAALVQRVGRVLVLWRPRPGEPPAR